MEVNRDHTPDIPKQFFVSAYPTLIVFGTKREKVYRFQSYMKPPEFLAQLDEGLQRYALYKKGEEWDNPKPRPEKLCEEGTYTILKAPSEKMPAGLAFVDGDLWVAQQQDLFRVDPNTGQVKQTFQLPEAIRGLGSDGKFLYAGEYGWTAGKPVHVIDPATGKNVRDIVTEANKSRKDYATSGVTWANNKLYVLEGYSGKLHELDPQSGEIRKSTQLKARLLTNIAFDGKYLVAGGRTELAFIDPDSGDVVRKVPLNYPVSSVGYQDGVYYLMELPVPGFDKQNKPTRIWPKETRVYKLTLPPQVSQETKP